MDNVAVLGERISSPIDCPPILEALTPFEDIAIILNSDNIPTFTDDNGLQFTVTDDETSFSEMTIVALSSDPNIINQLGLTLIDAVNGIFRLDIGAPHGFTGVADVTLRVTDSSGNITEQVILLIELIGEGVEKCLFGDSLVKGSIEYRDLWNIVKSFSARLYSD